MRWALYLFPLFFVSMLQAESTFNVGGLERKVKDSVAILDLMGDRLKIDLYFFSRSLTEDEKKEVVLNVNKTKENIDLEPLAKFWLIFDDNKTDCSNGIQSYQAEFKKNAAFPFKFRTSNKQIAWSFTANDLSDYGIEQLECELKHGSKLTLKSKHYFTIDHEFYLRSNRRSQLFQDQEELKFLWDLNITTKIFNKNNILASQDSAKQTISLTNENVKDTHASFIKDKHQVTVMLYKNELSDSVRNERYPNRQDNISSIYLKFIRSADKVVINSCSISFLATNRKGTLYSFSRDCKKFSNKLKIGGSIKKGDVFKVQLAGNAPSDQGDPKTHWDLDIETLIREHY